MGFNTAQEKSDNINFKLYLLAFQYFCSLVLFFFNVALHHLCSSSTDVATVLQTLASEALTDEGENVMAVEVLWTPSESGTTLSKRELIMDYPELIQL